MPARDATLPDPATVPLLTVAEVAALPGMPGERAVYEAIARGDLPARRFGRLIRVPTAELRRYLGVDPAVADEQTAEPVPAEPRRHLHVITSDHPPRMNSDG